MFWNAFDCKVKWILNFVAPSWFDMENNISVQHFLNSMEYLKYRIIWNYVLTSKRFQIKCISPDICRPPRNNNRAIIIYLIYEDDKKLFTKIQCVSDYQNIQRILNLISNWCCRNHLGLNADKCNIYDFCVNRLDSVKTLRWYLTQNLRTAFKYCLSSFFKDMKDFRDNSTC